VRRSSSPVGRGTLFRKAGLRFEPRAPTHRAVVRSVAGRKQAGPSAHAGSDARPRSTSRGQAPSRAARASRAALGPPLDLRLVEQRTAASCVLGVERCGDTHRQHAVAVQGVLHWPPSRGPGRQSRGRGKPCLDPSPATEGECRRREGRPRGSLRARGRPPDGLEAAQRPHRRTQQGRAALAERQQGLGRRLAKLRQERGRFLTDNLPALIEAQEDAAHPVRDQVVGATRGD
jgi:hypothetical protein